MIGNEELTYYEYWLTKKIWKASWAVQLIIDYHKFTRPWKQHEDYHNFCRTFREEISKLLFIENTDHVFKLKLTHFEGYDKETDQWIEPGLDLEDSDVKPYEFIKWMHSKGYQMPYEFKCFIGVEEKDEKMTEKTEERIDRAVCQGIGRTLWDIYPDMTIEEMQYLKAIQVYGGGKGYPGEGTLRRWLRVVDPRKVKTGPKTKL